MAAKRKVVPPRVFTPGELEQIARDLVKNKSGLSGSDFKKELAADLKAEEKAIVEAANRLAASGEIFRFSSAKKVRFFARDPFDSLANAVKQSLSEDSMSDTVLRERVEASQRGLSDLLKGWMKGALARGELFEHPPAPGTRSKRYATTPSVPALLKKVLAELQKVLASPTGQRVAKSRVLESIAAALGTQVPSVAQSGTTIRERFLVQLYGLALETKTDGLLPIRVLRQRMALAKDEFDRVAIDLSRDGLVTLHHHDFPASLSDVERAELVVDSNGNHFVGIAPRRDP